MKFYKKYFILFAILFLNSACIAQIWTPKKLNETDCFKCIKKWQYFKLQDKTKGNVIFHSKALGLCGKLVMASVTLIQTSTNDTIRVIELCNVSKDFKYMEKVVITPEAISDFNVNLPFKGNSTETHVDPEECNIMKTCYGSINNDN